MLALAVVAVSTIWVSSPEPVAGCELAPAVSAALAPLVPEITVAVGDGHGPGELRLRLEPAAQQWKVVLVDDAGAELLVRSLAATGTCAEQADAVALVVERYLSDLDWRPGEVAVAPDPAPVVERRRTPPEPPPPPPPAATPIHGDVMARALVALGPAQGGGAAGLVLARRDLRLALELGVSWPRSERVQRDGGATIGEVDLSSQHALVGLGVARGHTDATLWAGGERLTAAASGTALFQRVDQTAWQALVRGDLGYRLPLTARLAVRVVAGVEWRPRPVDIQIEGSSQSHTSPAVRAVVGAGVTWRLW